MKTLCALMLVLLCATVFATGKQETAGITSIDFLYVPQAGDAPWEPGLTDFFTENPNAKIVDKLVDQTDGSTMTIDALTAAGMAPNVYSDFMGRVAKYITPDYALDLKPYHDDLDDYLDGTLEPFMRDGKLLGLPRPGFAQGMVINVTMLDELGLNLPVKEMWTIAKFLEYAEKVKASYGGEKWATGAFAANPSGDYLMFQWFASFGAEKFRAGDYSRTVINTEAGRETMRFLKLLHERSYIEQAAPVLSDDDYAATYAQGKYMATAWFANWSAVYFPTAIKQGLISKPHEEAYIRFPTAPGVSKVPAGVSFHGFVAYRSGDKMKDFLAARLIYHLNSAKMQEAYCLKEKAYPNRKSVRILIDDPYWNQINQIVQENGTMDLGITTTTFAEQRTKMYPRLQDIWTGKQTPEEALAQYEKEVNEILAR